MTKEQWADTGERVLWTFVQGAIAAAPVGPIADWSTLRSTAAAAAIGGGAAVLALLKGMVKARRATSA